MTHNPFADGTTQQLLRSMFVYWQYSKEKLSMAYAVTFHLVKPVPIAAIHARYYIEDYQKDTQFLKETKSLTDAWLIYSH